MTPMEQRIYEKLNGRWRKARAIGLAKDARKLIQPLKGLVEAGLVERRKEGQDYTYRRKDTSAEVVGLPERLEGEGDVEYALRAVEALQSLLAPQEEPLSFVVERIVQAWADEGLEVATGVLKEYLDKGK